MTKYDHKTGYDKYKAMPMTELCHEIANLSGGDSSTAVAIFAFNNKQQEEKYAYEKAQIKLQHEFNMKLMTEQVRWIKISAMITAIVSIAAVLLGWYLSELKSVKYPTINSQLKVQSQIESNILAFRSEKTVDKVPLKSPIKKPNHPIPADRQKQPATE